jgi:uncharacterized damage-inducible protein DinB
MDPRVAPLASILDLNTDLLLNCLDGLDDDEARRRLRSGGNSIAFLAAHLTDSRHFLATRIGRPLDNPLAGALADARGIEDVRTWPPLDEIRRAWLAVSDHLAAALAALPTSELARASAHRFPVDDGTLLGMVAFLTQHDSYHLGQVAFLRRQLGKPPMAYTRGRRAQAGAAQPQT